ncbi:MAG: hypothetical protein F4X11_05120 [Acidobacteria bacterium]|nr:hypothetical protein [Acidobacteriota bacterium]
MRGRRLRQLLRGAARPPRGEPTRKEDQRARPRCARPDTKRAAGETSPPAETETERARRRAATLAALDRAAAEARRQAEPARESDYSSTRLWDACMALIEAAEDTLAAHFHE